MSFKKIKFIDPVEALSGKRNKNGKTCFFQGQTYGQRAWGTGERNLVTHPVTTTETLHRQEFSEIAKNVAKRLKMTSDTWEQDVMAFMEQRDQPGGYKTMKKWLWSVEKAKL